MYEHLGFGALDYAPCHYDRSKLTFRGPKRRLDDDYAVVLGGTEAFGKFIERPYAKLIEEKTGHKMVNLGCVNAGVEAFTRDPGVLVVCAGARVTVVQAMGAHNLSNRLYIVHPRRNDRFLRASPLLKNLFRDIDFAEFHFTRHMLVTLRAASPERFKLVVEELRAAWLARMKYLAETIPGRKILLHTPLPDLGDHDDGLGPDPLFVDEKMLLKAQALFDDCVHVEASDAVRAQGTEGMVFTQMEEPMARRLPGPRFHREIADALGPVIETYMQ